MKQSDWLMSLSERASNTTARCEMQLLALVFAAKTEE
jgi:hypothetical protein